MDMIWISTTMLKLPTCHLNTVKIQALRRSSSSWRHPSSVGHGLRYSMWFCVLNLGGVTNNSFMLGIVRVLSLDIVTILTYVYTIIIYIYIYVYILHRWVIFRMMNVLRTEATTWEMSCSP